MHQHYQESEKGNLQQGKNMQNVSLIGFPSGSDAKESACNAGDSGSISGSGTFPGEGNGYSL